MIPTFSRVAAALCVATAMSIAPLQAQETTGLDAEGRDALRAEIRAYLLENPEVLLEAMDILESRQAAAQAEADEQLVADLAPAILEDGRSWEGGNPEGDVTLVEFIDYRCGYCRKAHDEVAELIEGDGNIRFIVKEFPILGQASLLSSRFAIATRLEAGNDAYKRAHDALITMRPEPTEESLRDLASLLGLDADSVIARMEDPEVVAELRANRDLAEQLAIQGTPTFIVGDELVRGYVPLDRMSDIVSQQREES